MNRVMIDRDTAQPWVEVAHSTRLLTDVLAQVGEPFLQSNLHRVNALCTMEPASQWCRGFLTAALEHMQMWADHAAPLRFHPDAEVLHTLRPAQTLSRAALESASQAVWVMDATTVEECARRHLCLVLHDIEEQRNAAVGEEAKASVSTVRQTLLDSLSLDVSGIGRFPGYLKTVKRAAAVAAAKGMADSSLADPDEVERLWRASAGSAHGKRWPSQELRIVLSARQGTSGQPATVEVPDPAAITRILKLADSVVTYGVLRFADYCGYEPHLSSMLAAAQDRLCKVIPRTPGATSHDRPS